MSIITAGGDIRVFTNADSNRFSDEYNFAGGDLRVSILGDLDGATVSTLYLAATKNPRAFAQIRVVSWVAGEDDYIGIAGGAVTIPQPTEIVFQIENAGVSTSISLWATPLSEK